MSEYEPYGDQWKKEMSRHTKSVVIDILTTQISKLQKDLSLNASMLAKQCNMERVAESAAMKAQRELQAEKLIWAIKEEQMRDNFTRCKSAAEHWKAKAEELKQRDEVWREKKALLENHAASLAIQVSDMQCCGNCAHKSDDFSCNAELPMNMPFHCCDKWQSDGMTKESRASETG